MTPSPSRRRRGLDIVADDEIPEQMIEAVDGFGAPWDIDAFLWGLVAMAPLELTVEEIIADHNIMDKIDPRLVRHAFEEALIDCGLTNSEVLRR